MLKIYKIIALVTFSLIIVACSSDIINIKSKNFARLEKLTIRSDQATLGPLERIPVDMVAQIQQDIDSGDCAVVSIKVRNSFMGFDSNKASYSCENN